MKTTEQQNIDNALAKQEKEIMEIIDNLQNPYPKDVFLWDSKTETDFTTGRLNQFCFELWESWREELKNRIGEK